MLKHSIFWNVTQRSPAVGRLRFEADGQEFFFGCSTREDTDRMSQNAGGYQLTLHYIPEGQGPHLLCSRSLKSCKVYSPSKLLSVE